MNRNPANRVALVAALMVGVGALLSGFVGYLFVVGGVPAFPRVWLLPDPIGWWVGRPGSPLGTVGMLVAVILLTGLTWLFVRMVARGAAPGRGAAVFFGTWGAIVVAGWAAGVARAPLALSALRIPTEQAEMYQSQFFSMSTTGVTWALFWGWVTALVAALIHRASSGTASPAQPGVAPQNAYPVAEYGHPTPPVAPYPPAPGPQTPPAYPPQPPHAG